MNVYKLEWNEKQLEISNRILLPCHCSVCGTAYLSSHDSYTDIGKRCPLGHEQVEHYSKCGMCNHFETDFDEYGYGAWCVREYHNLKGWPFQNGCRAFLGLNNERFATRLAAWEKEQSLRDSFAKMRKENAKSKIIIQG